MHVQPEGSQGGNEFSFFDKVQQLADWVPRAKGILDHRDVRVLLLGSSALGIEHWAGNLRGRITGLDFEPLLL
jgi:predicted AAA+ superfamily ATPase